MAKKQMTFLCLLGALAGPVMAAVQDLRILDQQAREFVSRLSEDHPYQYDVAKADVRWRLKACPEALLFEWLPKKGMPHTALGVSCAAMGWKVQMPLTASERVMAYYSVRQIRAGEILQAGDVRLLPVDNRSLAVQAIRDEALIVGKAAVTTIAANSVLRATQLRLPIVVKMSQPVRIVVRSDNFSINGEGVALGSASIGDRVNVRVPSGKIVSGVVQDDLTVLLSSP